MHTSLQRHVVVGPAEMKRAKPGNLEMPARKRMTAAMLEAMHSCEAHLSALLVAVGHTHANPVASPPSFLPWFCSLLLATSPRAFVTAFRPFIPVRNYPMMHVEDALCRWPLTTALKVMNAFGWPFRNLQRFRLACMLIGWRKGRGRKDAALAPSKKIKSSNATRPWEFLLLLFQGET